ncbi:MAG: hypothetical protein GXO91_07640, partial [FCB group bacterium]|nr:hypothetical protein [FCB group bacterium]
MKHIKTPLLAIFLLTSIATLSFAQFANLSFGVIDEGAQTIEILMTNDTPVAGVQFNTAGATFSFASGGSSAENAWMVSVGGSGTVIGFTFGMAYIPATDVPVPLMYLHYTALPGLLEDVILSAGVVSGPPGQPALTVTYGPCDDPISTYLTETCGGGPGCMDTAACNYDPAATSDDGSCTYDDGTGTCCLLSEQDECGVCYGPGILPGECDCVGNVLDCAGDCGGTAVEDNCGTCDSDPTNDCVQDCNGDWGGTAVEDMCGTCDSDPTNDCVQDCNGDWGGTAVEDMCGTCDSDPTNDCVQDCNGDWGGTAV